MSELKNLKYETTAREYEDAFDNLLSRVKINKDHAVSLFMRGLPTEIEMGVGMFKPKTLADAYCLTNLQEATLNAVKKKGRSAFVSNSSRYNNSPINTFQKPLLTNPTTNVTAKPNTPVAYVPGHKCSGQLYSLVLMPEYEIEGEFLEEDEIYGWTLLAVLKWRDLVRNLFIYRMDDAIASGGYDMVWFITMVGMEIGDIRRFNFHELRQAELHSMAMCIFPHSASTCMQIEATITNVHPALQQVIKEYEDVHPPTQKDAIEEMVEYLGHVISAKGVATDHAMWECYVSIGQSVSSYKFEALRGFLGLTRYYRRFIQGYANISKPLTQLLKKNSFIWSDESQTAFEQLKQAMVRAPVLKLLDFSKEFTLETYALGVGLGAVLIQEGHQIAFLSKTLSSQHHLMSTNEKEFLAIVYALEKWRGYLLDRHFKIKIDHFSLKYLLDQRMSTPTQLKWLPKLMGFDYEIQYQKGVENVTADALSRLQSSSEFPPVHVPYVGGESKVESVDISLKTREEAVDVYKFHLKRDHDRMKSQADKHRTDREFVVGDWVYLKLQPHRQVTIRKGKQHKLSPKYYGPFQIVARVGQLKKCKGVVTQGGSLPTFNAQGVIRVEPLAILERRMCKRGNVAAVYVLV
ncbi:putative mitochondrial protein [Tanacetum coccineum]